MSEKALVKVSKMSGLVRTSTAVSDLSIRIERAKHARNAKVTRADAEYFEAVERAVAEAKAESVAETVQGDETPETPETPIQ